MIEFSDWVLGEAEVVIGYLNELSEAGTDEWIKTEIPSETPRVPGEAEFKMTSVLTMNNLHQGLSEARCMWDEIDREFGEIPDHPLAHYRRYNVIVLVVGMLERIKTSENEEACHNEGEIVRARQIYNLRGLARRKYLETKLEVRGDMESMESMESMDSVRELDKWSEKPEGPGPSLMDDILGGEGDDQGREDIDPDQLDQPDQSDQSDQ